MTETTKTRPFWGHTEMAVLRGTGIDIGCGGDPVTSTCRSFDVEDGDANVISRHVSETFDYVYSSHCLEHMHDPPAALTEWWKLVKPGGHLMFIVPDEDLYEQGVFPSRFNADHKATFTISKARSWSPRSFNVLDLANGLEGANLISLVLQDHGYDHGLRRHGKMAPASSTARAQLWAYRHWRKAGLPRLSLFEMADGSRRVVDQTLTGALAQIQCIVQKTGPEIP